MQVASRLTLLAVGLIAAGCAAIKERDKPIAPDMSALIDGYRNPSRNFDEATAIELQALVEQKVTRLLDLDAMAFWLEESLDALERDPQTIAFAPPAPVVLEGEGYVRITRICAGHGTPAPPVDQEANGFLELTAGYSQDGLDPVVFGTANGCNEQLGSTAATINGAVNLFVGEDLRLDQLSERPVIFQLSGFAFAVSGTEIVDGGFDFQICRGTESHCVPGHLEILLGLEAGATIVFFLDLAKRTGGFRGRNGVWTCDFLAGRCTDDHGDVVTTPGYQL